MPVGVALFPPALQPLASSNAATAGASGFKVPVGLAFILNT
jgi:hypothetical protein